MASPPPGNDGPVFVSTTVGITLGVRDLLCSKYSYSLLKEIKKKLKVPSIIIRRDADVRNGLNLPFTACLRGPPANVAVAKGLLAIVEPQDFQDALANTPEVMETIYETLDATVVQEVLILKAKLAQRIFSAKTVSGIHARFKARTPTLTSMDNSQVFVVVQANQLGQKLVSLFVAEMKLDEHVSMFGFGVVRLTGTARRDGLTYPPVRVPAGKFRPRRGLLFGDVVELIKGPITDPVPVGMSKAAAQLLCLDQESEGSHSRDEDMLRGSSSRREAPRSSSSSSSGSGQLETVAGQGHSTTAAAALPLSALSSLTISSGSGPRAFVPSVTQGQATRVSNPYNRRLSWVPQTATISGAFGGRQALEQPPRHAEASRASGSCISFTRLASSPPPPPPPGPDSEATAGQALVSSTRAADAMDVDSEQEQDGQPDAQSDKEDESEDEKEADERPRTRCLRGVGVESPYNVKLEVLQRRGRPELELFKTHMSTCMPLIVDRAIAREKSWQLARVPPTSAETLQKETCLRSLPFLKQFECMSEFIDSYFLDQPGHAEMLQELDRVRSQMLLGLEPTGRSGSTGPSTLPQSSPEERAPLKRTRREDDMDEDEGEAEPTAPRWQRCKPNVIPLDDDEQEKGEEKEEAPGASSGASGLNFDSLLIGAGAQPVGLTGGKASKEGRFGNEKKKDESATSFVQFQEGVLPSCLTNPRLMPVHEAPITMGQSSTTAAREENDDDDDDEDEDIERSTAGEGSKTGTADSRTETEAGSSPGSKAPGASPTPSHRSGSASSAEGEEGDADDTGKSGEGGMKGKQASGPSTPQKAPGRNGGGEMGASDPETDSEASSSANTPTKDVSGSDGEAEQEEASGTGTSAGEASSTGSASGLIPSGAPPLELNVEQDELPSNRKLKTAFSIKGRPYVYQSDVARTGNDFVALELFQNKAINPLVLSVCQQYRQWKEAPLQCILAYIRAYCTNPADQYLGEEVAKRIDSWCKDLGDYGTKWKVFVLLRIRGHTDEEAMVGFSAVEIFTSTDGDNIPVPTGKLYGELVAYGVDPSTQNLKQGGALLKPACQFAVDKGAVAMMFSLAVENAKSTSACMSACIAGGLPVGLFFHTEGRVSFFRKEQERVLPEGQQEGNSDLSWRGFDGSWTRASPGKKAGRPARTTARLETPADTRFYDSYGNDNKEDGKGELWMFVNEPTPELIRRHDGLFLFGFVAVPQPQPPPQPEPHKPPTFLKRIRWWGAGVAGPLLQLARTHQQGRPDDFNDIEVIPILYDWRCQLEGGQYGTVILGTKSIEEEEKKKAGARKGKAKAKATGVGK